MKVKCRTFSVFYPFLMVLALFFVLFIFSCKSTPSAPEPEITVSDESAQGAESDQGSVEDDAEDETAAEEAPDTDADEDSQEPDSDSPPVDSDPASDQEVPVESEVAPVVEVPPAEPEPVPDTQPAVVQPPVQAPEQPQSAPQQSAPQTPPEPPPFLRPAEPVIPQQERKPLPVPLNPLPDLPARGIPEREAEQVSFSRIVHATVGQIVEIPFRGTGWIYLGELGGQRGITYNTRRLDVEGNFTLGQSFIFTADAMGTYILKFYKQDFILDYIINDHVQVIVRDVDSSGTGSFAYPMERGRVVAEPRWPVTSSERDTRPSTGSPPQTSSASSAQSSTAEATSRPSTGSPPQTSSASSAQSSTAQAPASGTPQPAAPATAPAATSTTPAAPAATVSEPASQPQASDASQGQAVLDAISTTQAAQALSQISPNALPEEYIRVAKQEFDAGRIESALAVMEAMKQRYPSGTDEAWWLFGQLFEANSPARDVRQALEYYRRLVREYPQSARVPDAQRRIAYLERFYFNIR